jgi:hypothetical protein
MTYQSPPGASCKNYAALGETPALPGITNIFMRLGAARGMKNCFQIGFSLY